jgi:hypothetical protein
MMVTVKKWLPIFLIIIGIVALVAALGADLTPIGDPGFGPVQTGVTIAGVILLILGIVVRIRWGK